MRSVPLRYVAFWLNGTPSARRRKKQPTKTQLLSHGPVNQSAVAGRALLPAGCRAPSEVAPTARCKVLRKGGGDV